MKLTVLIENTTKNELLSEHGLSLYLETKNHKILFDSGQSGKFIENAKALQIDLGKVDLFILSHGHYDHGGGLEEFLKINKTALVYAHKNAFDKHYSKRPVGIKEIGVKKPNIGKRLILNDNFLRIDEELVLFSKITEKKYYPQSNKSLLIKKNNQFINDDFIHEQNLLIKENNQYFLIAGCAHKGMINIINSARELINDDIKVAIGGLHLYSHSLGTTEPKEKVKEIAKELKSKNIILYTGHCTGEEAFNILKNEMKDSIKAIYTGFSTTF